MNDALHYELQPFNIRVVLLEPGNFKTEFIQKALVSQRLLEETCDPTYKKLFDSYMAQDVEAFGDAAIVARLIVDVAHTENPERRYLVGEDAKKLASMTEEEYDAWIREFFA